MEQRAADGYLKILSLAEQEAQWLDSIVYNFSLDRKELEYGIVSFLQIPEPALTDRATAAALVSAFGSSAVHTRHTAWREAADAFDTKIEGISFQMTEDGDPPPTCRTSGWTSCAASRSRNGWLARSLPRPLPTSSATG